MPTFPPSSSPTTASYSTLDVISRMFSKFITEADVDRPVRCHLLRHTCATLMLDGGADIRFIQQLLGHEKLETTAI